MHAALERRKAAQFSLQAVQVRSHGTLPPDRRLDSPVRLTDGLFQANNAAVQICNQAGHISDRHGVHLTLCSGKLGIDLLNIPVEPGSSLGLLLP